MGARNGGKGQPMQQRIATTAALLLMCIALAGFVGCTGASSSSSKSADTTSSSSAKSSSASALKGDVYAMQDSVIYGNGSAVQSETHYTIDEHGNILQVKMLNEGRLTGEMTYEYDERGYQTSQVTKNSNGAVVGSFAINNEFDSQGRLVKTVAKDAEHGTEATTTYTYHDNGMEAGYVTESSSGTVTEEAFDENGFRTLQRQQAKDGTENVIHFEWSFDGNGNPTGYTQSVTKDGKQASTNSFEAELDENGNIIAYRDAQTGNLVSELTWVKVDQPSERVSIVNRLVR